MSKRAKTFEREVVNTWEQLHAARTGTALCWHSKAPRAVIGNYWSIMRVVDGRKIQTDPKGAWYYHGDKAFSGFGNKNPDLSRRLAGLEESKDFALETYGDAGPWVRNRMGDYVPKDINDKFPVRSQRD